VSVQLPYTLAVWRRNFEMYRRIWKISLLPNFFEPVFYLMAIGIGVGAYVSEMSGMSYAEFLAPGLICVAAMNGASFEVTWNFYVRLTNERAYDAMLTTPIQADDVLAGELLWALTRVMIYGGSFFIVVALFGLAPMPQALLALPAIPIAAKSRPPSGMAGSASRARGIGASPKSDTTTKKLIP
jgi:lipooligosaccharide transport system permease protein